MFNIKQFFLFILVALMFFACNDDSNPITQTIDDGLAIYNNDTTIAILEVESHGDDDHEDHEDDVHADPLGFQLEEDNQGTYTYRQLGLAVDGSIVLEVGETKEFSVHFLDCDDLISQLDCDAFQECVWDADDSSCEEDGHEHCDEINGQTACEASDHCEWHTDDNSCEDEEHGMHIEITGVEAGSTVFQIRLMHDGHADYVSLDIPITVVNPAMFSCNSKEVCLKKCCGQTVYASK